MISGKLTDLLNNQYLDEKLQKGFRFLNEVNFEEYSTGKHEVSDDLFFVVSEFESKEEEDGFWEAHRNYLDFHYILKGNEKIAVDHIDNQVIKNNYDEEKDFIEFDGPIESSLLMKPGDVMVCFPEDSHMTGLYSTEKQQVRKIILKLKI